VLDWYRSIVRRPPFIADIDVRRRPARRSGRFTVRDLVFESPAERLPTASRIAKARMVSPGGDHDRICILMAAWNDHGYRTRRMLARILADRGIASVMLENPLYGDRRPDPNDDRPLATAAEFAIMGRAAVVEGRSLADYLRRLGHRVGVAGYSMGGNLAAFIGTTVPFPMAVSPAASPHAAGPAFMHGILRLSVAWDALDDDPDRARSRLSDFLHAATVLDYEPPGHLGSAVIVAGTTDGFVPTASVQAIHRHWPGSTMEWVSAGHATLLWRNKERLADGIEGSFDRLAASRGGAGG
jgi:hypothetical protein